MRSRRQTLSQGPVARKPRSYLSRRKHSVAPHSHGSRRASLASEGRCLGSPCARRTGPLQPSPRLHCRRQWAHRNHPRQEARHQTLALVRLASLPSESSLERISAGGVTFRKSAAATTNRKGIRMNSS